MNTATIVTKKDARTLARLHAALGEMITSMDGAFPHRRRKRRKPVVRRAKVAVRETTTKAADALTRMKAKAAKLEKKAAVVEDDE